MWNILELPGPLFALTSQPVPSLAIADSLSYHTAVRLLGALTRADTEIAAMGHAEVMATFRTYRGYGGPLTETAVAMRLEAARHVHASLSPAPDGGSSPRARRAITDTQTGAQWPSVSALAAHLECTTHSVYRHLAKDPRYKTLRGSVYAWDVPHS